MKKREILEREGATKRGKNSQKTVPFDKPSASQFKSLSHAPATLRTDGIRCKFSANREAKQKSRLIGMCRNFRRSIVTAAGFEGTGIMILGMTTFTFVHVVLSLIGIFSGFVVVFGLLAGKRLDGWTALFLVSTVATSVTGFLFPFHRFLPSHGVGILSVLVLAIAILARYPLHLAGAWRRIYAVTAVISLYLNVFVLIAQAFQKVPGLKAIAPTQSEPPFLVTQAVALALFVLLGFVAAIRFRNEPVRTARTA